MILDAALLHSCHDLLHHSKTFLPFVILLIRVVVTKRNDSLLVEHRVSFTKATDRAKLLVRLTSCCWSHITACRDARTSVGGQKKVEGNANLWKTEKSSPIQAPLCKLFASPGVPIWLGPVNYACNSSTMMLISKIIKQTLNSLFQFNLDKS